jgi:hypothetical protein
MTRSGGRGLADVHTCLAPPGGSIRQPDCDCGMIAR